LDDPQTLLTIENFEIVKQRWNPMTLTVIDTAPIKPIEPTLEESESNRPHMFGSIADMEQQKEVFEKALTKVSGGLAAKMKLLDVTKMRFGGPPPDMFLKKSRDESGNQEENEQSTGPQHPFANNERYKVVVKMKAMKIPDGSNFYNIHHYNS
jgi:hypothetical protein